ncbi:cytochrome b [Ideonella sp.]|uniref:cytochrome b n=1 Tax=Ideonella sp. TaxID=1929293 RepID=UPI002B4A51F6|nr:cytochrome b [Ideonella sp.]HJV69061.1 cytochrome b [Ideonella sp.]
MNQRDSAEHYGRMSIGLHWLMMALLAAVYASIELRGLFPKGSDPRTAMKALHFMLGLTVLGLAVVRLMARITAPTPRIEPEPSTWQKRLATLMHAALYGLMIGLPIIGWLLLSAKGTPIPFFGLELPALIAPDKGLAEQLKEVHEALATAGYFLIGLHAAAALFHHYLVRDNTLLRMLPSRG